MQLLQIDKKSKMLVSGITLTLLDTRGYFSTFFFAKNIKLEVNTLNGQY